MRGDGHSTQARDVLDDVTRFASQRVLRAWETECYDVTTRGADLDGVNAQHTAPIRRRIRLASAVTVIGEDHEVESGSRRRTGDVIDRARPIRTSCVNVNCAAHRSAQCGR